METLAKRIHAVLDDTLTELEEARNVSVAADSIVKFNQTLQGANMYMEFVARMKNDELNSEKDQEESPPSS